MNAPTTLQIGQLVIIDDAAYKVTDGPTLTPASAEEAASLYDGPR